MQRYIYILIYTS